jgi:hypothetical protein
MARRQKWKQIAGNWQIGTNILQTNNVGGPTRIYTVLPFSDFHLETSFTMRSVQTGANTGGEAKIIFSDADKNENYRVDFMGDGMCRVTVHPIYHATPLSIAPNLPYHVRLTVKKHFLSLDVNDMRMFEGIQLGKNSDCRVGFGTYQASVSFSKPIITPFITKQCFVIMKYDDVRDFLYEDVLIPSLLNHKTFNFQVVRADKLLTAGKITEEIDERLKNADLVIADITDDNPNVFYELGLAHAYRRHAILLKQKTGEKHLKIPFDIKDFRVHPYDFSRKGFAELKRKLPTIITNATQ